MNTGLLIARVRDMRMQTIDVNERLSAEQAALRRQFVTTLYTGLQTRLADAGQPAAAGFLQLVIDDVNRRN